METKLLLFAVSKLTDEVEAPAEIDPAKDILIDTKEVMNMLGICYNSLCKLVKQGFIKRVRINQRRMKLIVVCND